MCVSVDIDIDIDIDLDLTQEEGTSDQVTIVPFVNLDLDCNECPLDTFQLGMYLLKSLSQ